MSQGGIFISYRRDDARWPAGRVADALERAFGAHNIFRDVDRIEAGLDFVQELEKRLASCSVMLVLIGARWLDMRDAQERRRLDDPQDWIRLEIATALSRNIRVVPVLLDGAGMPATQDLPADIQGLARRQAIELSDARFDADIASLVEVLKRDPALGAQAPQNPGGRRGAPPAPPAQASRAWMWPVAAGIFVLIVVGAVILDGGEEFEDLPDLPVAGSGGLPVQVPPVAPAAGGGTNVQQPAAPAPAAALDVSGMWRTNSGESYLFHQDGRNVAVDVEFGGQKVGSGRATLEGSLLRVTLTAPVWGQMVTSNCNMQVSADAQQLLGVCQNPGGTFPAQLYR